MGDTFDEASYLRANPDVAAAVQAGQFKSGWQHYEKYGRNEGRRLVAEAAPEPVPVPVPVPPGPADQAVHSLIRFERRAPSPQNAVDIFRDRWASEAKVRPTSSLTRSPVA